MTILLLGSKINGSKWDILHSTNTYEDMAKELDLYCNRDVYKSFSVISDKYFDTESKTITEPEKAFAETPDFVEDAFVEALWG